MVCSGSISDWTDKTIFVEVHLRVRGRQHRIRCTHDGADVEVCGSHLARLRFSSSVQCPKKCILLVVEASTKVACCSGRGVVSCTTAGGEHPIIVALITFPAMTSTRRTGARQFQSFDWPSDDLFNTCSFSGSLPSCNAEAITRKEARLARHTSSFA